jgi:hypothetical protein
MQNLRIALLCGADLRSIAKYESGGPIKPITEFGIRSAITQLRYRDPRPAVAEGKGEVQK